MSFSHHFCWNVKLNSFSHYFGVKTLPSLFRYIFHAHESPWHQKWWQLDTIFYQCFFAPKHFLFALFFILTRIKNIKIVRTSLLNSMHYFFLKTIRHEKVRISLLKQNVFFRGRLRHQNIAFSHYFWFLLAPNWWGKVLVSLALQVTHSVFVWNKCLWKWKET